VKSTGILSKTKLVEGLSAKNISFADLLDANTPVILKNVISDWPLVQQGWQSPSRAIHYLKSFDSGKPIVSFTGAPEIAGRYFYNLGMTGLNFEAKRTPFTDFAAMLEAGLEDAEAPSYYIGSTDLDVYFPGLGNLNCLPLDEPMFEVNPPLASIWIGNRTIASAHYDMSNNIACCVVGRRRFTLFPPDQVANLYPGPLEPTPGGQVVSMVDFMAPDMERHPRFSDALAAAEVADLEPGDVLIYPALWWHQVEALDPFNVLINYWWNTSPAFVDSPRTTLLHAMLSLRDRPPREKAAWKALFDYYVFGDADVPAAHLPVHIQGFLGQLDELSARRLRATVMNKLNR
jgi:Cupin-like domain